MTEETGEWLECVVDTDYEIFTEYPYPIKRKGSDKVISEWNDRAGYVQCSMNRKQYKKHRVIAQQFIENPNNLPEIDHINHNKADNRIENLRWVSRSENGKNKPTNGRGYHYTFIDELPETAEPLDAYNEHEFDGLFIDYETQKLYVFNDIKYRELVPCHKNGSVIYHARDLSNKWVYLYHRVLFG